MTRVTLMALAVLMTVAATASAQVALVERDEPPVVNSAELAPISQPRPLAPPAADLNSPRRRGSMVGYIDDAVVSSKLRVRFETALHDNLPDRAEFFYAKCGCYRTLPPANAAYDPAAPGPGPGIVTDLNFQQAYVQGEYAPRTGSRCLPSCQPAGFNLSPSPAVALDSRTRPESEICGQASSWRSSTHRITS